MKTLDDLGRELRELQDFASDSWSNLAIVEKIRAARQTLKVITDARYSQRARRVLKTQSEPTPAIRTRVKKD